MSMAILEELKAYEPELIEIRHDIHRHPETGFDVTRTAGLVARKLREWGVDEVVEGVGRTGVVATVRGQRGGNRAIGLRADMDALFIEEAQGREYRSTVPGKMHACGHDGHTAMLLGAARYLSAHRDFAGTVRFIFQPAEEGLGGASAMLADGLFERFPVDTVHGMHTGPGFPAGVFGTRKGAFLAATAMWGVAFRGSGGHGGAAPHLASDPTLSAAQFVTALQTIVSRSIKASETAVVSVGYLAGGDPNAPNVIPALAKVRGTSRCFSAEVDQLIEKRLGHLANNAAEAFGCRAEFNFHRITPALSNDAQQTDVAVAAAQKLVGERAVIANAEPLTGGEDFAYMLEKKPGSFVFIGNGVGADGAYHYVHTPDYDFNDAVLTLGSGYWVTLVRESLAA
jgi:hippurate hydrolase